jgi:hypothetical protein
MPQQQPVGIVVVVVEMEVGVVTGGFSCFSDAAGTLVVELAAGFVSS